MKGKKILSLGLSLCMGMSLIGCGNTAQTTTETENKETTVQTETKTAETEAETTTGGVPEYADITVGEDYTDLTATIKWIHHKTDREEDGTLAKYVEEFNKVYPNITVETEGITDYAQTALLRLPTGDWGDIMFIPAVDKDELSTYFMPYGTLESMDKEINFANSWEFDGMTYGVPYMGNAQGVVYNKAVFEAAGVTQLPKTPEEFIAALQAIKDYDASIIPLYTNYAAGWTMGAWDAYIGIVTEGDNTYFNQKFVHTANPFSDDGDGAGIYNLYKILYDAVALGLTEEDYTTTDWEGCKGMINNGEIGCMVLGSWAYQQMVDAGEHGEDIGYMPFPITVNGVQYANAGADYSYGINVNASDENKIASLVFVKWMTEESGWCAFEGGYTVAKDGENPPLYAAFDGCELLVDEQSLPGEETFLNDMNAESELGFNAGGNAKVQAIIEAADQGADFDEIMAEWTTKWNQAQEALGIEVNN